MRVADMLCAAQAWPGLDLLAEAAAQRLLVHGKPGQLGGEQAKATALSNGAIKSGAMLHRLARASLYCGAIPNPTPKSSGTDMCSANAKLPSLFALPANPYAARAAPPLPSPASFSSAGACAATSEQASPPAAPAGLRVKAKRKRANSDQLAALRTAYAANPFPSAETRRALARRLAMTPRSVQIWFQNQRQIARHQPKSAKQ